MAVNLIGPEWRDVSGYEGYYQVSNFGHVRSCDRYVRSKSGSKAFRRGKVLSTTIRKDGKLPDGSDNYYVGVVLSREGKRKYAEVHRLVAQAFLLNTNQLPQVNHKDGVKYNNLVDNLEWCTQSENMQHALRTGLKHVDSVKCRAAGQAAKVVLSKKVYCVNNSTWYGSRREAAIALNIPESSVYDSLRDGRPHRGYVFREVIGYGS